MSGYQNKAKAVLVDGIKAVTLVHDARSLRFVVGSTHPVSLDVALGAIVLIIVVGGVGQLTNSAHPAAWFGMMLMVIGGIFWLSVGLRRKAKASANGDTLATLASFNIAQSGYFSRQPWFQASVMDTDGRQWVFVAYKSQVPKVMSLLATLPDSGNVMDPGWWMHVGGGAGINTAAPSGALKFWRSEEAMKMLNECRNPEARAHYSQGYDPAQRFRYPTRDPDQRYLLPALDSRQHMLAHQQPVPQPLAHQQPMPPPPGPPAVLAASSDGAQAEDRLMVPVETSRGTEVVAVERAEVLRWLLEDEQGKMTTREDI